MLHEVVILNSDKEVPKFSTKKALQKYLALVDIEKFHEPEFQYEYSNGYYTQHFYTPKELLYFLSLEDL